MLNYNEFKNRCINTYCPRGNNKSKRCKLESRMEECFKKYTKIQSKPKKIYVLKSKPIKQKYKKDIKWEETKSKINLTKCMLWECLNSKEKQHVLDNYKEDFMMLSVIDPAHILGKGSNIEKKYDPDNIVPICRYFHTLLTGLKDPITRKQLSQSEIDIWYSRVKQKYNEVYSETNIE